MAASEVGVEPVMVQGVGNRSSAANAMREARKTTEWPGSAGPFGQSLYYEATSADAVAPNAVAADPVATDPVAADPVAPAAPLDTTATPLNTGLRHFCDLQGRSSCWLFL